MKATLLYTQHLFYITLNHKRLFNCEKRRHAKRQRHHRIFFASCLLQVKEVMSKTDKSTDTVCMYVRLCRSCQVKDPPEP